MRLNLRSAVVSLAFLGLTAAAQSRPPVTLDVHVNQIKAHASPMLHGLMTEEINYSYDGGLYGELIRNREFHANDSWQTAIEGWKSADHGGAQSSFEADKTTGPSEAIPYSAKVMVENASGSARAGIANEGYWGIPVRPSTTYKGSFYAKSSGDSGPIHVALVNDNTGVEAAHADVPALTSDWKQYQFTLTTNGAVQPSSLYRLEVTASHPGTYWFSMVSLFPPTYHNRPEGNRIDLMEKMAAMHPTFLRFPGGNYLEGDTIKDRFQWKNTIGPDVDRPTHLGPWGYRSSDGMGLLEFLDWCQDLHMQPVLAVYAGYSLKGEHVEPGPDLDLYVNNALDEIEYVTGDASTKWGAERVKDGHPEPFDLKYVEIGNEDWFDKSGYDGRFAQFYKAIKAKYPNLQLIATAPVKTIKPDVLDEHFYKSAEEFYNDAHHYDKTDRNGPKIFVGEWATMEGDPTPDFGAALGDAAWMTGMERNSDIVIMSSYAPMFVNVSPGAMQWHPDLIGYNAMESYGSPSYYAQVMFGKYHGDEIPQTDQTGTDSRFFYSVTRDSKNSEVYIKLVNAGSAPQPVDIKLDGATSVAPIANVVTLSAKTEAATNSIDHPKNILPVESRFERASGNFTYTLPAYSIQVLRVKTK